jgi:SAM-dependent methyltransferase
MRVLYSLTIGCSSILLFALQPMMAKSLLPRFGGSAGVWVTCMLFFQAMLLVGYLYSWLITTRLDRRAQSILHGSLLMLSMATISLRPRFAFADTATANPALSILGVLLLSIGLPYFLLSATSPLLQSWFANSTAVAFPYWLFALSNAASLTALLAYPVAIEPLLPQSTQLRWWWIGYGLLALLAVAAAVFHAMSIATDRIADSGHTPARPLLWIGLAACGSTLWMAVANHLSQEVAPVPFLWILPLSVYLLSFILCFESDAWYRPRLFRVLLPIAWLAAAYRISNPGHAGLAAELAIFSVALFIWCMFCHGEIARTKPTSRNDITFFYLMIALGGALGAMFVGLAAPNLLTTYLELPIGIAASIVFALYLLYGMTSPARLIRLAFIGVVAFIAASKFSDGFGDAIHLRNFYGALQVSDSGTFRTLYNGRTLHGIEFMSPDKLRLPTAYYGPESGVGQLLSQGKPGRRIGLVGLGVGTLAAYGQPGDTFRFYEINPAVIDVARRYFHFLGTSAATTSVIEGDGRLALEREPPDSFDILVLDAFADDSIPVHLLTREAFATYFHLLRPGGVLAIHLTNRYLDLLPVVEAASNVLGKHATEIHSEPDPERQILVADWALVTDGPPVRATKARLWTDDYSNLFQVLR